MSGGISDYNNDYEEALVKWVGLQLRLHLGCALLFARNNE